MKRTTEAGDWKKNSQCFFFLYDFWLCFMWLCCCSLLWTAAPNSPFSVTPSSCDLAPLKSTSFRVNYDPKQPNTLHTAQLECFAYNKVAFKGQLPLFSLYILINTYLQLWIWLIISLLSPVISSDYGIIRKLVFIPHSNFVPFVRIMHLLD